MLLEFYSRQSGYLISGLLHYRREYKNYQRSVCNKRRVFWRLDIYLDEISFIFEKKGVSKVQIMAFDTPLTTKVSINDNSLFSNNKSLAINSVVTWWQTYETG